jgi:hypothetical protein
MSESHRLLSLLAWIWLGYAATLLTILLFATLD